MEEKIGKVLHFYDKIGVGIIELSKTLKQGDNIHIKGHTTEINQEADSIQINREDVPEAKKGDQVGIKVSDKVREGDEVFLVKE